VIEAREKEIEGKFFYQNSAFFDLKADTTSNQEL
jgi:hypothetical protein